MGRIRVLDKAVAELIAAGEVVERPASIAKELLENAVDAGARSITVEIKGGGIRYLRVTDDGSGILREDIPRAFLRHATSKVRKASDLDGIRTLGFRGEALASIAAMCRVELTTRTAGEAEGSCFRMEGGEGGECFPAGCPVGTTIVVRDVFFNTPARMKFLKKDVAEGNAVALAVDKCALAHPEIAFHFIRDGQTRLRTSGSGDLQAVILAIYNRDFAGELLEVDYTFEGMRVTGYISRPGAVKPSRTYQNFFINSRYVRTRTCSVALEEAYKNKIMTGKFPACVLNLELEPGTVDVNVHPAKIEVRFVNERPVFNAVYFAAKSALASLEQPITAGAETAPAARRSKINALTVDLPDREYRQERLTAREVQTLFGETGPEPVPGRMNLRSPSLDIYVSEPPPRPARFAEAEVLETLPFQESYSNKFPENAIKPTGMDTIRETAGRAQGEESFSVQEGAKLLGELFGTYILLQAGDAMLLVDKHAAHERMLYEQLKENLSAGSRQVLLSSQAVTLSREDYQAVLESPAVLEEMGFLAEDFGEGTLLVREVPLELGERDIAYIVREIAGRLRECHQDLTPDAMDRLYYSIACKSALRAGDKSRPGELAEIVRRLEQNPQITHCPHGRPVSVRLSRYEIEKLFGRQG